MSYSAEIHVVQQFAANNLVRNDKGEPKTGEFGGHKRNRIPSVSMIRAMRQFIRLDDGDIGKDIAEAKLMLDTRSKRWVEEFARLFEVSGKPAQEARDVATYIVEDTFGFKTGQSEDDISAIIRRANDDADSEDKIEEVLAKTMLNLGPDEVERITKAALGNWTMAVSAVAAKKSASDKSNATGAGLIASAEEEGAALIEKAKSAAETTAKAEGKDEKEIKAAVKAAEKEASKEAKRKISYAKTAAKEVREQDKVDAKKGVKKDSDIAKFKSLILSEMDKGTMSIFIAMFGRMTATKGIDLTVDGAVCRSQALSTHKFGIEDNWYCQCDDLQPKNVKGSGFISSEAFGSAVLYRYLHIDFAKLLRNLKGNKRLATLAVRVLLRCTYEALPSGKQHSFNVSSAPAMIRFVVRPTNRGYDNFDAFSKPVCADYGSDLLRNSLETIGEYAERFDKANNLTPALSDKSFINPAHFGGEIKGTHSDIRSFIDDAEKEVSAILDKM